MTSKFRKITESIINEAINTVLLEAKTIKLDAPEGFNNNMPYDRFIALINPNPSEIYNFWKNSKYHDIRAVENEDTGDYFWTDAYYLTHPDLIHLLYTNGYLSEELYDEYIGGYDGVEITQDRSVHQGLVDAIPGLDKYFYISNYNPETYQVTSNNKYGFTADMDSLYDLAHNSKHLENPEDIKNIENPDEDTQLQVIAERPELIKYIKNPTEKVKALYNTITHDEL